MRRTVLWILAAVAGVLVVAGVTAAASTLSTQTIGLSSEPLTAGDELAPRVTATPHKVDDKRRKRDDRRGARSSPSSSPAPSSSPGGDDHDGSSGGDDHGGSDDGSGSNSGSSGGSGSSGSDDSGHGGGDDD
jgi:uncharacterized membrane protein YgcG